MMIAFEVFVGGGWILAHDWDRGRSDCVIDKRCTDNDTADDAEYLAMAHIAIQISTGLVKMSQNQNR